MADLFDAQTDSAVLQAAIERYRMASASRSPAPSSEPLFHTDHQGNLVDRAGNIVRERPAPLVLGKPKV